MLKYLKPVFHEKESVFVLFDIDGVVCKSQHWKKESKLSQKEWLELKKNAECDEKFILAHKLLRLKKIPFLFVTGRRITSKKITENMFKRSNITNCENKILYYPEYLKWIPDDYITFKIGIAKNYKKQGFKVYVIDDSKPVINRIKKMSDKKIQGIYYSANDKNNFNIEYLNT